MYVWEGSILYNTLHVFYTTAVIRDRASDQRYGAGTQVMTIFYEQPLHDVVLHMVPTCQTLMQ